MTYELDSDGFALREGVLDAACIAEMALGAEAKVCEVKAGGALLMRPLLVHASSACSSPAHRRVLHFDFAATDLAGGLKWASRSE